MTDAAFASCEGGTIARYRWSARVPTTGKIPSDNVRRSRHAGAMSLGDMFDRVGDAFQDAVQDGVDAVDDSAQPATPTTDD